MNWIILFPVTLFATLPNVFGGCDLFQHILKPFIFSPVNKFEKYFFIFPIISPSVHLFINSLTDSNSRVLSPAPF